MMIQYEERTNSNFEGTIIDIETTGEFNKSYDDSRQYRDIYHLEILKTLGNKAQLIYTGIY